ncbi:MAG TPA: mechanosensitive ion channel family protein, partial [Thermaerobacter sp.]
QFGDFALIFEFVYFVTDPDYLLYMDIQQSINLGIYRRFSEEGIQFAYPTRTIYVAGAMTAAGDPAVSPADARGAAPVAGRELARESSRESARGRAGGSPADGGRQSRTREPGEA